MQNSLVAGLNELIQRCNDNLSYTSPRLIGFVKRGFMGLADLNTFHSYDVSNSNIDPWKFVAQSLIKLRDITLENCQRLKNENNYSWIVFRGFFIGFCSGVALIAGPVLLYFLLKKIVNMVRDKCLPGNSSGEYEVFYNSNDGVKPSSIFENVKEEGIANPGMCYDC